MGGVSGDFGKLDLLVAGLDELAAPGALRVLTAGLAGEAKHQIVSEFRESRDPYGAPWAKLAPATQKAKGGKTKILTNTARLKDSFVYDAEDDGFNVTTNVAYAAVHQNGGTVHSHSRIGGQTRTLYFSAAGGFARKAKHAFYRKTQIGHTTVLEFSIPRRSMVPTQPIGGLGVIWREAFHKEGDRFMRRWAATKGLWA